MARTPRPAPLTPPRAPSQREWAALTRAQRAAVVAALPGEVTDAEMSPPEGDRHFQAKIRALDALGGHFRRLKRRVYLAAELPVYYPAERRFAPDLLAVFDVDSHERDKYVVSAEGKGLDIVFEVHVGGDRKKDAEVNVARYARLGIPEYFIYDRGAQRLFGFRLPVSGARKYVPIVPQQRRYQSQVLGLELAIEDEHLRFYLGNALLLESADLIERLQREMAEVEARVDAGARAQVALSTALEEETRRREEETRRREEETRLREEETRLRKEETRLREEEGRLRRLAEKRLASLERSLKRTQKPRKR